MQKSRWFFAAFVSVAVSISIIAIVLAHYDVTLVVDWPNIKVLVSAPKESLVELLVKSFTFT